MLYVRSSADKGGIESSVRLARVASAIALVAYPAGCLTRAFGPDTPGAAYIGYGLIFLALLASALLAGTTAQRVAAEEPKQLDEYELALRYRATQSAYATISGLALLGVFYMAVASDKGLWFPQTYEQLNALFWGIFLYASILPSTFVAWKLEPVAADQ
jgi:hypothetical protein